MSNVAVIETEQPRRSVLIAMSERFGMMPQAFEQTLRATVVPANCSKEQFAAFLLVARQYNLNPITKEIYAFPAKGGGIQPIVGIDGWMRIINDHPQFDGMEFEDTFGDSGNLVSITCRIFRKDRHHPVAVTEYMGECSRETDPWKKWPARMLRHKAAIQCARYGFGFSGIIDPDEYERGIGSNVKPMTPAANLTAPAIPAATGPHEPQPKKARALRRKRGEPRSAEPYAKVIDHDPSTGEIIDDEIPAEFDRHEKTPAPAEETAVDPDAYLDDLDAKMSGAKTDDDLDEIWAEHLAVEDSLFPPDRDRAQELFERHEKRLNRRSHR